MLYSSNDSYHFGEHSYMLGIMLKNYMFFHLIAEQLR